MAFGQTPISLADKMKALTTGSHDTTRARIYGRPGDWGRNMPPGGYTSGMIPQSTPNPWYISEADRRRWPAVQKGILTEEYKTAYGEAKAANLKRYEEILAGYKTRYGAAMTQMGKTRTDVTGKLASTRAEVLSGLEGLGEEELAGIGRRYTKERASTAQHLISTGLHSTTVAPAVQAGVTRREGYAVGEAQERLRRERLGYVSQLGAQELQALRQLSDQELMMQTGLRKEELDFAERRTDEYPSESLYVQLMQGLGGSWSDIF